MNFFPNRELMKLITKPLFLAFFLTLSLLACNNEDLFVEPTAEVVDPSTPEDTTPPNDTNPVTPVTAPCDFKLDAVQANSTVIINCVMDLQGKTVNLPANVTLVYEGGDIINGTLNFSSNATLSGELMNASLTMAGSKPQLKAPVFEFKPTRWGIVEGEVTQEVAARNNVIVNDLLIQLKNLGISTLKMDKIDAYFYANMIWRGGIEVPSNMNFVMTENTHLRVHLASTFRSLIFIGDKENIKISGGNLHGNRNLPGFNTAVSSKGERSLIVIKTGVNITIENIHLRNSAIDGINIESMKHAYEVDYVPSRNILVRGCTFDSSRRNNLSITDGIDMVVENCTFLNAGINMQHSDGEAPRFAIDLEPHVQDWDKPLQHLEGVILRNNVERGSVAGGIVFADGDHYIFENNDFQNGAHLVGAANTKIINNVIGDGGITLGDDPGNWYTMMRNENNVVSGNTITGKGNGTGTGINLVNKGIKVFDNHIINFGVGIMLRSLKDSHIYNNVIESNGPNDDGINAMFYVSNVVIEKNTVKVKDFPVNFIYVNNEIDYRGYSFTFKDNILESPAFGFFNSTYGINFNNNIMNNGLRLYNTNNAILDGNTIKANRPFTIELNGNDTNNVIISNNILENTDTEGMGHGIVGSIISSTNKNIKITNNHFLTKGYNNGINLTGFHGITVKDNSGYVGLSALIDYSGNNSTFTNNTTLGNSKVANSIQGSNNTIN